MVANVSCGNDQYNHTINTLKYADRAKEIKTNVQTNVAARGDAPGRGATRHRAAAGRGGGS